MSLKLDRLAPVTSWSNGRKAAVYLLQDSDGSKFIKKAYRPGFRSPMCREFVMAAYAASRMTIVPRVLAFRPWRDELFLEYLPGERVLEWVLRHFGPRGLVAADFQSFHGLDPPHNVDARVAHAFARFRDSSSDDARQLKSAIRESYALLHRIGVKHGSADPRNLLYHQNRIYIIDFDNARPSFNPAKLDYEDLRYWFGIDVA